MSLDAVIWWTILTVAVVLSIVTIVILLRAAGEVRKLQRRTATYAALPIVAAIERGRTDAARLQADLPLLAAQLARAEAALTVLRRGPISADVVAAVARLRAAVDELRELAA